MLNSLNASKKFPVIIDSIQLHNVMINWVDTSVYDQRYNFDCGQAITVILNKQENGREFYVIMY